MPESKKFLPFFFTFLSLLHKYTIPTTIKITGMMMPSANMPSKKLIFFSYTVKLTLSFCNCFKYTSFSSR